MKMHFRLTLILGLALGVAGLVVGTLGPTHVGTFLRFTLSLHALRLRGWNRGSRGVQHPLPQGDQQPALLELPGGRGVYGDVLSLRAGSHVML